MTIIRITFFVIVSLRAILPVKYIWTRSDWAFNLDGIGKLQAMTLEGIANKVPDLKSVVK